MQQLQAPIMKELPGGTCRAAIISTTDTGKATLGLCTRGHSHIIQGA